MDENKKPGPRDISDLKARLGLKKTAAMPAAAPSPTPPHGQPVTPPPQGYGAPAPQQPSGPPPPFGRREEPPPPAQPAAPADPRRDPFASAQQQQAAANLAAFYGLGQSLPGSADSVGGEPLSKPKPWGRIVAVLAIAAIPFVVGNACGRIQRDRIEYNTTTDQAGQHPRRSREDVEDAVARRRHAQLDARGTQGRRRHRAVGEARRDGSEEAGHGPHLPHQLQQPRAGDRRAL